MLSELAHCLYGSAFHWLIFCVTGGAALRTNVLHSGYKRYLLR